MTAATPEKIRSMKEFFAFFGPPDTSFSVEYRLPGEAETRSVTLTTGAYRGAIPLHTYPTEEISSTVVGERFGYIQWRGFTNLRFKLAFWENFLAEAKGVQPDVLVPVSEEFLAAQLAGGAPLLDAAVELLNRETQ